MSHSQSYPPCPDKVYSLHRFYAAVAANALPGHSSPITVGGRIRQPFLVDFGGQLELPADFFSKTGAQNDETWIVTFPRSSFCLSKSESEDETKRSGVVQVYTDAQRLTHATTEISDLRLKSENILAWGPFVSQIKGQLRAMGLLEVMTPTIVQNPGMEPELEPFRVSADERSLYLATSPELHLKQLLALGFTDIFEIKTVYRKEERTEIHEPEFHMLEWYRGYANLETIAADLTSLITAVTKLKASDLRQTTIAELFRVTGFELQPNTQASELYDLATRLDLHPSAAMDWNDLFHLIWVAKVEPNLPHDPMFVRHYPPTQAALARVNSSGWAERLEFYWHGVEIANAFHELNNPTEQRARFQHDQKKRVEYHRTPLDIDENFMQALEYGLPPSGGIALGVDRLFMLARGMATLREVRAFGFSHQFRQPKMTNFRY